MQSDLHRFDSDSADILVKLIDRVFNAADYIRAWKFWCLSHFEI